MPDLLDNPPNPGSVLMAATLPAAAISAFDGRRLVRDVVSGHADPLVVETALLLTTELISNATACADTPLELRVLCSDDGSLVIEVADTNPALPRPVPHVADAETGRGLRLINALADDWGARRTHGGKVMWFALRR